MQRGDFEAIFKTMAGLPVTIRLLDPPLHEFLPHKEEEFADVAKACGSTVAKLRQKANALHETNPMLGHRGCRLGITFPEIYEMQARAIIEAALNVEAAGDQGAARNHDPAGRLQDRAGHDEGAHRSGGRGRSRRNAASCRTIMIGTMIELPRAALRAGELAETAEFFSFGTNDLTQTTLGLSRDDAGMFLPEYLTKGVLKRDPFVSIDRDGVGELIKIAAERGRSTRPNSSSASAASMAAIRNRSALSRSGAQLRLVFAVPRAGGASRRRAGRAQAKIERDV